MNEGSCDTRPLDLSSGEELYESIFLIEHPHLSEDLRHTVTDHVISISTHLHRECDILIHCFFAQEFKILKDNSELPAILDHFLMRKRVNIPSFFITDVS
jgi:hypothetical protein